MSSRVCGGRWLVVARFGCRQKMVEEIGGKGCQNLYVPARKCQCRKKEENFLNMLCLKLKGSFGPRTQQYKRIERRPLKEFFEEKVEDGPNKEMMLAKTGINFVKYFI